MKELVAELRTALARRGAEAGPLDVFFRDDDVDEDEESLRLLLALFLRRGAPVILGVIPGGLSASAVGLLAAHPGAIELTQHGWRHLNHEPEGRKCEFGPSRTFGEQLDDIARGKARMTEAFGPGWFPAFIPPWNRCTAETCRALDELGFEVLSRNRGAASYPGHRLREFPVTLDLYRWRDGAVPRPEAEVVGDLAGQVAGREPIGIMLHHKVMTAGCFSLVEGLLEAFSRSPVVRYHTFRSLIESGRDDETAKG